MIKPCHFRLQTTRQQSHSDGSRRRRCLIRESWLSGCLVLDAGLITGACRSWERGATGVGEGLGAARTEGIGPVSYPLSASTAKRTTNRSTLGDANVPKEVYASDCLEDRDDRQLAGSATLPHSPGRAGYQSRRALTSRARALEATRPWPSRHDQPRSCRRPRPARPWEKVGATRCAPRSRPSWSRGSKETDELLQGVSLTRQVRMGSEGLRCSARAGVSTPDLLRSACRGTPRGRAGSGRPERAGCRFGRASACQAESAASPLPSPSALPPSANRAISW